MPVDITCPSCGRTAPIADDRLGRNIKCPECATPFRAMPPDASSSPPPLPSQRPSTVSSAEHTASPKAEKPSRTRLYVLLVLAALINALALVVWDWDESLAFHIGVKIGHHIPIALLFLPGLFVKRVRQNLAVYGATYLVIAGFFSVLADGVARVQDQLDAPTTAGELPSRPPESTSDMPYDFILADGSEPELVRLYGYEDYRESPNADDPNRSAAAQVPQEGRTADSETAHTGDDALDDTYLDRKAAALDEVRGMRDAYARVAEPTVLAYAEAAQDTQVHVRALLSPSRMDTAETLGEIQQQLQQHHGRAETMANDMAALLDTMNADALELAERGQSHEDRAVGEVYESFSRGIMKTLPKTRELADKDMRVEREFCQIAIAYADFLLRRQDRYTVRLGRRHFVESRDEQLAGSFRAELERLASEGAAVDEGYRTLGGVARARVHHVMDEENEE